MLQFAVKVTLISASGALTPGPLTAASAAVGARKGWIGGFFVSLGHLAVELPLVILIAFGILSFLNEDLIKILSIVGGSTLLTFAYLTAKSAVRFERTEINRSPLILGIVLTAFNPFFLIWWATIGAALVSEAILLSGFFGLSIFYISHVWLDFFWLSFVAGVSSFSSRILLVYRIFLIFLAAFITIFGLDFLLYGFYGKRLLLF
ncbi:MAG: LysE family translocator [Archaeoglobaceae archaeon]|nr:LysE family translocator [Archaeoglobaceae archaeon]MCX8151797.1 LysE family translocator [Archaeoglobaceae archaeon]MDW8013177.1 LysE family transporter [Archaeoglobaceae archaeon]